MRKIQIKWLARLDRGSHAFLCLDGQGLGEKGVRAMVFLEVRHGMVGTFGSLAVILFPVITARRAKGGSADIDVESQIQRLGALMVVRTKVSLAHMDGLVAVLAQDAGQRDLALLQSGPVPLGRAVVAAIIIARIDPVGRAMPGRILAGHDRNARRRAHTHRVELVETNAPLRQPLHARRAVVVIERITLRLALGVRQERNGGVHDAHVIDQEDHDVGLGGRGGMRDNAETGDRDRKKGSKRQTNNRFHDRQHSGSPKRDARGNCNRRSERGHPCPHVVDLVKGAKFPHGWQSRPTDWTTGL